MAVLVEDDRVIRNFPELMAIVMEEYNFVARIPDGVLLIFLDIIADPAYQSLTLFRSDLVLSVLIGLSFLDLRCWRQVRQKPFRICLGDIHANVMALVSLEKLTDDEDVLYRKIFTLVSAPHELDNIIDFRTSLR